MQKIESLKPSTIFKTIGLVLVAFLLISLIFQLMRSVFFGPVGYQETAYNNYGYGGEAGMPMVEMMDHKLSIRNSVDVDGGSMMNSAEESFDVTEYFASIESRDITKTCLEISSLKEKAYIVFENSNEYDNGCSYSFKAKKENADEVLVIINSFDPKDLSQNTFMIKQLVDDFTSEEDILEKKKASIEATLNDAVNAYNEIASLATKAQDAESLAKIIDSKISIIERLSQEKININEKLERLKRAKAEQLERLNYVYFRVQIFENKYFDIDIIKDSWKASIKNFVREMNDVLQDITINLIALFFRGIQAIIYFFIIVVIVKYGWYFTKKLWNK
ncbi:hypothetical protein ISS03_01640 [Patescibacteria group bacterium]|nr:hypothetical protein [Patescibacteria group bacterium]